MIALALIAGIPGILGVTGAAVVVLATIRVLLTQQAYRGGSAAVERL